MSSLFGLFLVLLLGLIIHVHGYATDGINIHCRIRKHRQDELGKGFAGKGGGTHIEYVEVRGREYVDIDRDSGKNTIEVPCRIDSVVVNWVSGRVNERNARNVNGHELYGQLSFAVTKPFFTRR